MTPPQVLWLLLMAAIVTFSPAKAHAWNGEDYIFSLFGNSASAAPNPGTKSPPATAFSNVGGKAAATVPKELPWPGKNQAKFMAQIRLLAEPKSLAKRIVNPTSVLGLVGTSALAYLFAESCVRGLGGTMELAPGGKWEQCIFATGTGWVVLPDRGDVVNNVPPKSSKGAACTAWMGLVQSKHGQALQSRVYVHRDNFGGQKDKCFVYYIREDNGQEQGVSDADFQTSPGQFPTGEYESISQTGAQQKLEDLIVQECNGNTARCHGLLKELTGQGVDVEVEEQVSGPATGDGGTKTEQKTGTNAQGQPTVTNITTNTTLNFNYNGDTVTKTETVVTTTTTTNQTTGETTTETETRTEEDTTPQPSVSDTELPAQPTLYERKYPDGVGGVWNTQKTALLQTPLGQLTTQLMPNIGDGGTCPVWNLSLDLGVWDFGTYDVAPACEVWGWAKIIVLIGALILARALIFGG